MADEIAGFLLVFLYPRYVTPRTSGRYRASTEVHDGSHVTLFTVNTPLRFALAQKPVRMRRRKWGGNYASRTTSSSCHDRLDRGP